MREFDSGVVGGEDEFCGGEICEGGGELIGAVIDGIPERGNGAEALLGVEFGLPVLGCGLVFECGEDLEGVGGSGSGGVTFLCAKEPH